MNAPAHLYPVLSMMNQLKDIRKQSDIEELFFDSYDEDRAPLDHWLILSDTILRIAEDKDLSVKLVNYMRNGVQARYAAVVPAVLIVKARTKHLGMNQGNVDIISASLSRMDDALKALSTDTVMDV